MAVSPLRVAITISAVMRGARAFSEAEGRIKGLIGSLKAMRIQLELLAAWHAYDFLRKTVTTFAAVQDSAYMTTAMLYDQSRAFSDVKSSADSLTKKLIDLSAAYPKSPQDIAGGYYKLISSGIRDETTALEQMNTVLKFSTVGYTSVNNAVNVGIKAMAAYKMQVSELPHIYDVVYTAANDAVATVDEFSQALVAVMPTAAQAGESLEDTAATLSFLTQAFKSADEAATAYRRMLMQFQKMGTIRRLQALGINIMSNAKYTGELATKWEAYNSQINALTQSLDAYSKQLDQYFADNRDAYNQYGPLVEAAGSYREALELLEGQYSVNTAELYKYENAIEDLTNQILQAQVQIEGIQIDLMKTGGIMTQTQYAQLRSLKIQQMEYKKSIDETKLAEKDYLDQSKDLKNLINIVKELASTQREIENTYNAMDKIVVGFASLKKPSESIGEIVDQFQQMDQAEKDATLTAIGFTSAMGRITAQRALMAITQDQISQLKAGTLSLQDVLEDVNDSAGSVDRAFSLIAITMNNKVVTASNQMVDAFVPFAEQFADFIVAMMPMIKTFAESLRQVAVILGMLFGWMTAILNLGGGKGAQVIATIISYLITLKLLHMIYNGVLGTYNFLLKTKIATEKAEVLLQKKSITTTRILTTVRNAEVATIGKQKLAIATSFPVRTKEYILNSRFITKLRAGIFVRQLEIATYQEQIGYTEEMMTVKNGELMLLDEEKIKLSSTSALRNAKVIGLVEEDGVTKALVQTKKGDIFVTKLSEKEIAKETALIDLNASSRTKSTNRIVKYLNAKRLEIQASRIVQKQQIKEAGGSRALFVAKLREQFATKNLTKSKTKEALASIKLSLIKVKEIIVEKAHQASLSISLLFSKSYRTATYKLIIAKLRYIAVLVYEKIAMIATTIATAIYNFLLGTYEIAVLLATAATWAFNVALYANPIFWVIIAIVAMIAVLYLLWKNWDKVTDALKRTYEWFINLGKIITKTLIALADFIKNGIQQAADWFRQSGRDAIVNFITGAIDAIKDSGHYIMDALKSVISFDNVANDRMAFKWGQDMAKHFNKGASLGFNIGYSPRPMGMGVGGDNIAIHINVKTDADANEIADKVSSALVNQKKRRYGGF